MSPYLQNLKLKPLPAIDLAARYALIMGNGMIKHYSITLAALLTSSGDPTEPIIQDIRKEAGLPDLPVEVIAPDLGFMITDEFQDLTTTTFLALLDSNTRKDLLRATAPSTLYQYVDKYKNSGRFPFLAPLVNNKLVQYALEKLRNFCEIPFPEDFGIVEVEDLTLNIKYDLIKDPYKSKYHKLLYGSVMGIYRALHYLFVRSEMRKVAPAMYLTVTFAEKEIDVALQAIADDLNLMGQHLKIKGNFCVSKVVPLNNTIGNDGKVMAILCAPFIDLSTLPFAIYSDPRKANQYIRDLGVKYLANEGQSNYLNGKEPYSEFLIGQSKHIGRDVLVIHNDSTAEGLSDGDPQ